ncbi:HK97 family phage prohead protease [Blastochloris viridis]|uniref:Gene transfer agent prohead protease n=1 Tax=Blastochloris viridis TaxID=1079 RepID=A0A0H5BQA7_BLAVI|nr:HK97 family phage prohead protease [Blastochloris viridis]ALK09496.1 Caudovirus prohead protease [Blastochloris viridis]BAS00619.1 gene transfer agent prohead protease [Blastochloris viridis]CUU42159.1 phage prohead protease, HK97 family [Blastochloris viridis]
MERLFIETKLLSDDSGAISGIGWKYDQPDRIGDMIAPGALAKAAFPLPMLAFHDMGDPIGTWDSATDKGGAWHVKGHLLVDEVARAREVRALVRAGAIKGLSIGFITGKAEPRQGGGRLIKSLELIEVSLVTLGMHPGAKVTSAKSAVLALNIAAAINRATAQIGRS